MSLPEVIGLEEAAGRLGISYRHAKTLAAAGKIPGQLPKIGSMWMVSVKGITEYLDSYSKREVTYAPAEIGVGRVTIGDEDGVEQLPVLTFTTGGVEVTIILTPSMGRELAEHLIGVSA